MKTKEPKILVHLHIFYHDQVEYFIDKLKNISGCSWDLAVTFIHPDDKTFEKIRNFKPDTNFIQVENIGYDIFPFIEVLKSVNLNSYDYVIKLHTKRAKRKVKANVIPMKGMDMRNRLVDGVLYSPVHFKKILNIFEKSPHIGMISNLVTYSKRNWDSYAPHIQKEMSRLGLESKGNYFCMGTMFIARSSILKPLQSSLISSDTFSDTLSDTTRDFKSAHYYERLISILPYSFGLIHKPLSPRKRDELWIKIVRFPEKPLRWIFGIEKKGPEKRKFIRIFGMEFYIQSSAKSKKV